VKSSRTRRGLLLLLLGLLAAPPVLWGVILALVPTDWARDRVVEQLAKATGQPVRLHAIRLGALGGLRIEGLEVGRSEAPGPWLRVDAASADVNLAQLVVGHIEPSNVEADGVDLRIHRGPDGSLEFGDLLRSSRDPGPPAAAAPAPTPEAKGAGGPDSLAFRLRNARIRVIDEPTATSLDFADLEGNGTWHAARVTLDTLRGTLNGGHFELSAQLDRSAAAPAFEARLHAERVKLGVGMGALSYLVPVLAGETSGVEGKLDLDLALRGQGATPDDLLRSLSGKGNLVLDPVALEGSKLVAELSTLAALPADERVGSVRTQFVIGDGRVATDDLTLKVAQVPIGLAGWTDFQGRVDYRIRTEGLTRRLSRDGRGLLASLPSELHDLVDLHLEGSLDRLKVTVGSVPLSGGDPAQRDQDRERLRDLGRRLKDKFLR
jgi:AsmA protein